jgi:hypothetical protein
VPRKHLALTPIAVSRDTSSYLTHHTNASRARSDRDMPLESYLCISDAAETELRRLLLCATDPDPVVMFFGTSRHFLGPLGEELTDGLLKPAEVEKLAESVPWRMQNLLQSWDMAVEVCTAPRSHFPPDTVVSIRGILINAPPAVLIENQGVVMLDFIGGRFELRAASSAHS